MYTFVLLTYYMHCNSDYILLEIARTSLFWISFGIFNAISRRDVWIWSFTIQTNMWKLCFVTFLRGQLIDILSFPVAYSPWSNHVEGFWSRREAKNVLFLTYEDLHTVNTSVIINECSISIDAIPCHNVTFAIHLILVRYLTIVSLGCRDEYNLKMSECSAITGHFCIGPPPFCSCL